MGSGDDLSAGSLCNLIPRFLLLSLGAADLSPSGFLVHSIPVCTCANISRAAINIILRALTLKSESLWRQRWIDQAINDVNDLASQENCSEADILCELRNALFCKSVFGRTRGGTRVLKAQDILNE